MAEFHLQKQMVEAAKERSSIAKALLAIQQTLDKMGPAVSHMVSVLDKLEPTVTTTDTPAKARPTGVLGTNPGTTAIEGSDLPSSMPTNCSTKGLSHDDVDEQPSVAAIPNTTMSGLLPVTTLVPAPEFVMLEDTKVTSISPDATVFVCPNATLDAAYKLFDEKPMHADVDLVASLQRDTGQPIISTATGPRQVTNHDLGAELRPRPWPSFVCSNVCTVLQLDKFRSLTKIALAGMPRQHSVGFLAGDDLALGCPVQPQSISSRGFLQYELLHTWTNVRKEALREEKMLHCMVALMGPKPWFPWDCFSLEANFSLPHVTRVLCVTSPWCPGVHKNLMTNHMGWLELEMVMLMTIAKGEFISRCVQIHPNKHAQLNFPWSSCYLFLPVGKLQNIMVELKTWPSGGWFLSAVTLSLNLHDIVCYNKAVSIQSLVVALYMAECCGELISVIATHTTWLLKLASPDGSPVYIQVRIGSILFIWTSQEAQFDREYLSIQLPLVDQVLWRILEYWCLDVQGLPLADASFEDSFWPKQHIIEACLASPDHRFMVTNAVEWLYNHNSYGQHIEVGNRLNGKGRVPWLADGIVVTTPGYPLQAKKIPYPCTKIVTARLFGSDEIKCLEVLSNILQCTDNYLSVIMFDEIEPQLTIHWKEFVVQGKAMVVSNITKPTMYTDVSPYRMKTELQPLYVSISTAEGTSHRNNSIYPLVEQQLSFPASTCTHAHIQAAIGENQGAYSLCCNFSCHLPNTIATWVEYTDRQGTYSCGEITMDHHSRLGFLNLGVLLTWTHVSMVQITELPCTELSSQNHPMPSVDQLMMKKRSYRCLVRANTSPKIMLECSATELIAWVLGYVRTFAAYSSQSAFFTRLNGWRVMGQPSVLGCTSLVGKQGFKEGGVSCLWPSSSIKYASATSITSTSTKPPTMTTTSTMSESSTSFKSTSTRATSVKATTTNLAAPWDPGKNSSAPAWGQAEFQGGRNVTGTTTPSTSGVAQGRHARPKRETKPNPQNTRDDRPSN